MLAEDGADRRSRPGRALIVVLALALGALILRIIGLQFGLPAVYNPDEVAILARALDVREGLAEPAQLPLPDVLFLRAVCLGRRLPRLRVRVRAGVITRGIAAFVLHRSHGLYTAGRALGVASGVATVLLVQRLGASLVNRRAGLAAAVFMAAAPLSVRDSHYIKHDVFATMLIVAAYVAIVRVWPEPRDSGPRRRDGVIAGAACGAAFSTHYYCVFLALPLAWAVVQAWRSQGGRRVATELVIAGVCSAAVFFALSPFIAVEPITAWRDITANRAIVVDRAATLGAVAPAFRYFDMLWRDTMGIPVVVLGAVGAIWMLVQRRLGRCCCWPSPFRSLRSSVTPFRRRGT